MGVIDKAPLIPPLEGVREFQMLLDDLKPSGSGQTDINSVSVNVAISFYETSDAGSGSKKQDIQQKSRTSTFAAKHSHLAAHCISQ